MNNFPIFYKSTHHLNYNELKKYVFFFKTHIVNFTVYEHLRLVSYHKFNDGLQIKIVWMIKTEEFSLPKSLPDLFLNENTGHIFIKNAQIINYSNEEASIVPSDSVDYTFFNLIKAKRAPLSKEDYYSLEFNSIVSIVEDEKISKMVEDYKKFEQYLLKREEK